MWTGLKKTSRLWFTVIQYAVSIVMDSTMHDSPLQRPPTRDQQKSAHQVWNLACEGFPAGWLALVYSSRSKQPYLIQYFDTKPLARQPFPSIFISSRCELHARSFSGLMSGQQSVTLTKLWLEERRLLNVLQAAVCPISKIKGSWQQEGSPLFASYSPSLPSPSCAGIPPRSIWVVGVRGHLAHSLKSYLNRWLQRRRKGKNRGENSSFPNIPIQALARGLQNSNNSHHNDEDDDSKLASQIGNEACKQVMLLSLL